ncbi:MAG: nitroreductase/quinone reductase family protein [Actinomycetota bacterium]
MSPPHADPQFCYVTTRGRVTGNPHQIEIWFAREPESDTIYMLSGGRDRSDWVRNMRADETAAVHIGEAAFNGVARIVDQSSDEDALARKLLGEKYGHTQDLTRWLRESLPIAIDLRAQ